MFIIISKRKSEEQEREMRRSDTISNLERQSKKSKTVQLDKFDSESEEENDENSSLIQSEFEAEFNEYSLSTSSEDNDDPLIFWSTQRLKYKHLSEIATFVLVAPASCTISKSLSNYQIDDGLISRKRRKTLLDPIYNYVGIGSSYH